MCETDTSGHSNAVRLLSLGLTKFTGLLKLVDSKNFRPVHTGNKWEKFNLKRAYLVYNSHGP
jgi:hypothetical protein